MALRKFLPAFLLLFACAPLVADDFTKILVDRDGVVRVTDRELARAGERFDDADVPNLRLTLRGHDVPLRVETLPASDPGGRFAVEFLGAFPHGTKTWENEYTTTSTYFLSVAPAGSHPARVREERAPAVRGTPETASPFTAHHEVNKKLIRFTGDKPPDESWFWAEIKATDAAPTQLPIAVEVPRKGAPLTLRVHMVGYSHMPQDPDHSVDVSWNGVSLGKAVWDGENATTFTAQVPAANVKDGTNALALRALGEKTGGIDLVLLDWVEVEYLRRNELQAGGQALVRVGKRSPARVTDAGEGTLAAWSADGTRRVTVHARAGHALLAAAEGTWRVVRTPYPAHAVAVSHPLDLKAKGSGADFVVISHERFLAAAEKLAAARRAEGLKTLVVPVGDVYDRFNDGFLSPEAIRDFLRFAWKSWSPRPRYALLVGDASWDFKNATVTDQDYEDWHWSPEWARQVPKNSPYLLVGTRNDHLFVPTHQYQSPWGHAADDNWFAVMEDDARERPDIAIGRLTVSTPEEGDEVVDKILAYGRLAPGAMKSALFITNDEVGFQRQTDMLADQAGKEGYDVVKVYPKKEEKDNAENTKALLRDFDAGPAFVLFNGHGGRYIWRTGPPDLTKNHDLFTLDHLDQLADTADLPVVVSLTCYSAPFDHPIADSIGEKMLRLPHKGAIAVIASSWRNAPPLDLGRRLLQLLGTADHPRIGDAFLAAKRDIADRIALSTYNLLGDPTTPYRGPARGAAPEQPPAKGVKHVETSR